MKSYDIDIQVHVLRVSDDDITIVRQYNFMKS